MSSSRLSQCIFISECLSATTSDEEEDAGSRTLQFGAALGSELGINSLVELLRRILISELSNISNQSLENLVAVAQRLTTTKKLQRKEKTSKSECEGKNTTDLSILPNDIVSKVISFSSSVEINQVKLLSRQIYRISQNLTIYSNHNDFMELHFNERKLTKLLEDSNGDAFIFQQCKILSFSSISTCIDQRALVKKLINLSMESQYCSNWFSKLLMNVTEIKFDSLGIACLSELPVHILFDQSLACLRSLKFSGYLASEDMYKIRALSEALSDFSRLYGDYVAICNAKEVGVGRLESLCYSVSASCMLSLDLQSNYTHLDIGWFNVKIENISHFQQIFHPKLTSLETTGLNEKWFSFHSRKNGVAGKNDCVKKPPQLSIEKWTSIIDPAKISDLCKLLRKEYVIGHLQLCNTVKELQLNVLYEDFCCGCEDEYSGTDASLFQLFDLIFEGNYFYKLKRLVIYIEFSMQNIWHHDELGTAGCQRVVIPDVQLIRDYWWRRCKSIDDRRFTQCKLRFLFQIPNKSSIDADKWGLSYSCYNYEANVAWKIGITQNEWHQQFQQVSNALEECIAVANTQVEPIPPSP